MNCQNFHLCKFNIKYYFNKLSINYLYRASNHLAMENHHNNNLLGNYNKVIYEYNQNLCKYHMYYYYYKLSIAISIKSIKYHSDNYPNNVQQGNHIMVIHENINLKASQSNLYIFHIEQNLYMLSICLSMVNINQNLDNHHKKILLDIYIEEIFCLHYNFHIFIINFYRYMNHNYNDFYMLNNSHLYILNIQFNLEIHP